MERVIVESDSLNLTQAIKSKTPIAKVYPMLEDIWKLAGTIQCSGFTWTLRQGNALAHEVAKNDKYMQPTN
ncbi:hypothetical protein AHAS_Ahas06G0034200 [Arachis hypogaea]